MPEFQPGELKTARAPITVQPSGLSCQTELYLVSNGAKVATSGVKVFTSTGAKQDISFSITMPSAEGTYPVYLDIFTNGLLIGAYKAVEDVVIAVAVTGELTLAYVWWEGQAGWLSILSSNNWPSDTEITTSWKVRNTGNKAAFFKVRFMGLTSAGVLLNPGEDAWLYLYPVTPGPGTYSYTVQVIADSLVVAESPIEVTTAAPAIPFTFSGVWVQRVRCESATAWNTLNFGCTISNPTSGSITHTLTPMYRSESKYGYSDPRACSNCVFTLTLNPGQSYNCTVEANYYDAEDRRWRCAVLLGFSAGVPYGGCAFLRDEDGNDSPQKCV